MFEAARWNDEIEHTGALAGFLVGAVVGLAIAAYAATMVCSGGTAAFLMPIALGLLASALPAWGEYFGKKFSSPAGVIQLPGCSTDVYINNRNAAHVELSLGRCEKHPAPVQVAEGSSNVFINSVAAARKYDRLTCGARISGGSDDVFIGGGTVQYFTSTTKFRVGCASLSTC